MNNFKIRDHFTFLGPPNKSLSSKPSSRLRTSGQRNSWDSTKFGPSKNFQLSKIFESALRIAKN